MEVSTGFMLLIPIVIGVMEAVKATGFPSRFAALGSLALGIAGAFFIGGTIQDVVLQGLVVGLSASGLYSATRATFNV